jgi:thiopurine S-methyltransferase
MNNLLDKDYWEQRYQQHNTGWDIGYASPPITNYCQNIKDKSMTILIPGAGNAYEAEWLVTEGFKNVSLIDIAPSAIAAVKKRIPALPDKQIFCGDFFAHVGQYELIIEQTFFCALSPGLRQKYVEKCHQLLADNGKIAGLLFDFPLDDSGPPYGGNKAMYRDLFAPYFTINTMQRAKDSIKPRQGSELFFEMVKS